ncbi:MAG: ammonia channel protein, partial [Thermus sp.]
ATFLLIKLTGLLLHLRPSAKEEGLGLDVSQHGEEAYTSGEGAVLLLEKTPPRYGYELKGGKA